MQSRLILFDVDGTLVDAAGCGRRAMSRAFEVVFGLDPIEARSTSVPFAGMTDLDILDALAAIAGIDGARLARERPRLERAYLEALVEALERAERPPRALPGALALVEALHARDRLFLGLVTGNMREGARAKLAPFGLDRYFPDGGFGSDHRDRRELARIAVRRLARLAGRSFEPECVVVVGDTEQDVDCARTNGFRAVAVASGCRSREELAAAAPDFLLPGLADLPVALAALGLVGP